MTSRRDLVREYKERELQAGIFRITNTRNGKALLGSSLNLHGPLNKHRFLLTIRRHPSPALQLDWNEVGPDAFSFEVVEVITPKDEPGFDLQAELLAMEQRWIERVQPTGEQGYNLNLRIRE